MPDQPAPPDRRARYERKRRQVNISLTPAEYDQLRRLAAEHGFTATQISADGRRRKSPAPAMLGREVIRAWLADGQVAAASDDGQQPAGPSEVAREVRRIGGNINQAVKLAQTMKTRKNLFGKPVSYEKELAAVWEEVKRLVQVLESFLAKP
ncbi:MAG: hypothetical protein PWQ57_2614 [Desulfovibrionales bacterium]|jgi:hypothetical protein|nr:hypothetical protein [Desulfovibrionales bacterium]